MQSKFGVVDLFAGPGGLAEGFSSLRGRDDARLFEIALSVEKEESAFQTLRLRSLFRQFDGDVPDEYYRFIEGDSSEPDWKALFPTEWQRACNETLQIELGAPSAARLIDERLRAIKKKFGANTILIGGPPCQAYSLVGRARNRGTDGYVASKDPRHFLYKEYIRILQELMPAAFVMENVKGLLSSAVEGNGWKSDWKRFCSEGLGIETDVEDVGEDDDESDTWIEEVVRRYCETCNFVEHARQMTPG